MSTATKSPTVQVTIATFNDRDPVFRVARSSKINKFAPLTGRDYRPNGMTPLRDAAWKMISHLESLKSDGTIQIGLLLDESGSMMGNQQAVIAGVNEFVAGMRETPATEGGRVLCMMFTDGKENASREITASALSARVASLENDGWTFIYMGANMDAWGEARVNTGISGGARGQSVNYAGTFEGTTAAFMSEAGIKGRAESYLSGDESYAALASALGNNSTINEDGTVDPAAVPTPAPAVDSNSPYSNVTDALNKAKGGDEI